ncbi:hypothetical protein PsYK624_157160 [Phanerochaete sordida]|uniref:F-box domain-containing protein n=1 Tax=Phanerochaete sordida TaxID=48140 RepID=A0A9P3GPP6_9APHY|nr:hypothetical protein PsYK624_157160 [Phanerochaete sordida]
MPLGEDLSQRLVSVVHNDSQPKTYAADPRAEASGSVPTLTFPFELVDTVLENLHPSEHAPVHAKAVSAGWRSRSESSSTEDPSQTSPKRDLLACSSVCRLWNGAARAHLFRDVVFVVHSPHARKAYKTFADFDRFLQGFPVAAAAIRSLRLDLPDQYKGRAPQEVSARDLASFLARMPRIERLHLRNVHLTRAPTSSAGACALGPQFALAELKIEYNDGSEPNQVVVDDTEAMLMSGLFSRADTLHLSSYSVREVPDHPPEEPPCAVAVDRLVVERAYSGSSLFTTLRGTQSLEHLRALEIAIVADPGSASDMLKNPRFTELVAPQLEHITVRLQRVQAACGTAALDVSSFTQLRTLTLGIALNDNAHVGARALQHVLRSYPLPQLSRALHPHLRMLKLRVALDPPPNPFSAPPHPFSASLTAAATRRRQARVPPESWMATLRPGLDEVDRRLVDTVERCGLAAVVVECEARADAHAGELVPQMFPVLHGLGQLDLRVVILD